MTTDKVAVFLDVENLSQWLKADRGASLLAHSKTLGRVAVRRAYGNFSHPSVNARQDELTLLGFELIHVYHPVKGKNSADIQIVVDVMDYIVRIPDLKWFVLATGDADFSPLFRRLRELGKGVVGVGPRSALSEAVENSCHRFIYTFEQSKKKSNVVRAKKAPTQAVKELLRRVLSKSPAGIELSRLKNQLLEVDPEFDESNFGCSQFKKFIQSVPDVVILNQRQNHWWAVLVTSDGDAQRSGNVLLSLSEEMRSQPTAKLYRRFLKKKGWRSFDAKVLWDAITKLDYCFPGGFTRQEGLDTLSMSFSQLLTSAELEALMDLLYKSKCLIYLGNSGQDCEYKLLTTCVLSSEKELFAKVDIAMLSRLSSSCQTNDVVLSSSVVTSLLLNNYSDDELKLLIAEARAA